RHAHGLVEERALDAAVDDSGRAVEVWRRDIIHLGPLVGLEEAETQALGIVGPTPEAGGAAKRDLSAHGGGLCHTRGPRVAGYQTSPGGGEKYARPASISRASQTPSPSRSAHSTRSPRQWMRSARKKGSSLPRARSHAAIASAASRSTLRRRRMRSTHPRRRPHPAGIRSPRYARLVTCGNRATSAREKSPASQSRPSGGRSRYARCAPTA